MTTKFRELYPIVEPFNSGFLQVSSIHNIYYEEVGNPKGNPCIYLHGGPGGGFSAGNRGFFDPNVYRVILFDQRGAGKSTPFACLEENTTWDLVEDIEKIRKHLNIEKWVVFGGSWGSTLALSYAEKHTERVKALILRGIFTLRRDELLWFYQEGASWIFPDVWDKYLEPIPVVQRGDIMSSYYRVLTGSDEEKKIAAARAWTIWEMSTSRLHVDHDLVARGEDDKFAIAFARIECHYFVNGGFFEREGQLIEDSFKLKNIPGVIVQGRYDLVCPMKSAWDLSKKWPEAKLIVVDDAGHSAKEPGIQHHLLEACDKFKNI